MTRKINEEDPSKSDILIVMKRNKKMVGMIMLYWLGKSKMTKRM